MIYQLQREGLLSADSTSTSWCPKAYLDLLQHFVGHGVGHALGDDSKLVLVLRLAARYRLKQLCSNPIPLRVSPSVEAATAYVVFNGF